MSEAVVSTREEDTRLAPGLQVLLAWLAVSFVLVRWWSVGILPATDADDLLKAHEIRFLFSIPATFSTARFRAFFSPRLSHPIGHGSRTLPMPLWLS